MSRPIEEEIDELEIDQIVQEFLDSINEEYIYEYISETDSEFEEYFSDEYY